MKTRSWLLVVAISFLCYLPALNNFFVWDDFVWLHRAKILADDPWRMFNVDVTYFDPVVYLSFWFDYLIAGTHYQWYHFVDLSIHAVNGVLIWYFVKKQSDDASLALFSGVIFAASFAASDAVLWSSSRVDLLAVMFSLLTLVLFQLYLKNNRGVFLAVSLVAFILALGSKGTPVVIPFLMLALVSRGNHKDKYLSLLPFAGCVALFFILLKVKGVPGGATLFADTGLHLNFNNFMLALVDLFVPERMLLGLNIPAVFAVIAAVLLLSLFIKLPGKMNEMKWLGLVLMVVSLAPVLILFDLKIPDALRPDVNLLTSPSHRIYLASVGLALFMGSVITAIYNFCLLYRGNMARYLFFAGVLSLLSFSFYEIQLRETIWEKAADLNKRSLYQLLAHKQQVSDDSVVGLVRFPMSRGFIEPMLKVYLDVNEIMILPVRQIPLDIPDSPDVLRRIGRSNLFVRGKNEVFDLTAEFRQLLTTAVRYHATGGAAEKKIILAEYTSQVEALNQKFGTLINL